ncbi:MAG: 1-(5-phosphoribosyl)-5-[(5-phosphoribosylamino)methylideneamino]imidazole-4-carboxamide isomerase [Gammaproteobacteria bacterium]
MIVYPAIDLINGSCVRLEQGNFNRMTTYSDDPVNVAKGYREQGARWIHIVDLDGARIEQPKQTELISEMVSVSEHVQVGGGIRTREDIECWLEAGVKRVVIGSICALQPQLVQAWLNEFGADKIVLALDVTINELDQPMVAIRGWQASSQQSLWSILDRFNNVQSVLCTDISRDGMGCGANVSLYKSLMLRYPNIEWIASGGVGCFADIQALKAMGAAGVIVGKALYENKISLDEVLLC